MQEVLLNANKLESKRPLHESRVSLETSTAMWRKNSAAGRYDQINLNTLENSP